MPGEHATHWLALEAPAPGAPAIAASAGADVVVPAGQSEQAVAPPAAEYVPPGHGEHVVDPALAAKKPGAQLSHVPSLADAWPAAQACGALA